MPHGSQFGVAELSRQTGFQSTYISRLLKAGETPEKIKARAIRAGKQPTKPNFVGRSILDRLAESPAGKLASKPGRHQAKSSPDDVRLAFLAAQIRKETAIAEQREIELAVSRGELIPTYQVQTCVTNAFSAIRDITLRVGELADRLAIESDPHKCRAMIVEEVTRALGAGQRAVGEIGC
jgi:hypothetical protein